MRKKAQGLSLNTIIVAAIVLIVLIVLWAIFTGKMGGFTQGLGSTTESVEACNKRCTATGMYVKGIASSNACKEIQMGKVRTSTGGEENCCCTTNAAATGTPTTKTPCTGGTKTQCDPFSDGSADQCPKGEEATDASYDVDSGKVCCKVACANN